MRGKSLSHTGNKFDKKLRVSVGHIQTDELDLRDGVENVGEVFKVSLSCAGRARSIGQGLGVLLGKLLPLIQRVVLVNAGVATVL